MNTQTITINIQGQLSLDRASLEQFLRGFTTSAPVIPNLGNQQQTQTGESSFITEMQLLKKLSVSRRTIFTWRMAGKIPAVKLGKRTLYHWPSVEAALLRHQRGGQ